MIASGSVQSYLISSPCIKFTVSSFLSVLITKLFHFYLQVSGFYWILTAMKLSTSAMLSLIFSSFMNHTSSITLSQLIINSTIPSLSQTHSFFNLISPFWTPQLPLPCYFSTLFLLPLPSRSHILKSSWVFFISRKSHYHTHIENLKLTQLLHALDEWKLLYLRDEIRTLKSYHLTSLDHRVWIQSTSVGWEKLLF